VINDSIQFFGGAAMNALQRLIDDSPFTQGEIAEMLGITQTYLSLIVNEKKKPGRRLARDIADLFGKTADELGI